MDVEVISQTLSKRENVEKAIVEVYRKFSDRIVDWKISSANGIHYVWFVLRKDDGK